MIIGNPELNLWRAFVIRKACDMLGHNMACGGSKKNRRKDMRRAYDDAWAWYEGEDFETMLSYADLTSDDFTEILDFIGDAMQSKKPMI